MTGLARPVAWFLGCNQFDFFRELLYNKRTNS
jgi:hypothetical protein